MRKGQGEKEANPYYSRTKKEVDAYYTRCLEVAKNASKPLVLEEFGLARDDMLFYPENSTSRKDAYYDFIFGKVMEQMELRFVSGVNFWAWGGEGRPSHKVWQDTDDWIGDPPHEDQGWYSVYDHDTTIGKKDIGLIISPVATSFKKG